MSAGERDGRDGRGERVERGGGPAAPTLAGDGEGGDVVLKILHTADWHLGLGFPQFEARRGGAEDGAKKLQRARLDVVEAILGQADRYAVDAVLVAGDVFDAPSPPEDFWRGLLRRLEARRGWTRPLVLLPGNHDPLTPTSVWAASHPFRQGLPAWVHVVDRDDFALELGAHAVVHAVPCRSQAGDRDLALALPPREPGDARVRIGLCHGSTVDIAGFETHFPIARDAALRRAFDYLAIGDTHSFRDVTPDAPAPLVYPGAPEPTTFREDGGSVAVVTFPRGLRPRVHRERVARHVWRESAVTSLAELRALAADEPDQLARTVLRLRLRFTADLAENEEVEALVRELGGDDAVNGRVAVLQVDRSGYAVEASAAAFPAALPDVLKRAAERLAERIAPAHGPGRAEDPTSARARRALAHLYRMVRASGGARGDDGATSEAPTDHGSG